MGTQVLLLGLLVIMKMTNLLAMILGTIAGASLSAGDREGRGLTIRDRSAAIATQLPHYLWLPLVANRRARSTLTLAATKPAAIVK